MPPARESRLIEQRILVPTGSAIAIVASLALILSAQSPPPPLSSAKSAATSLIAGPEPVMLGTLEPGRKARFEATLTNPRPMPVVVDRFETSCPCIRATAENRVIGPGETTGLTIEFDPSHEPGFRGSLTVEYVGKSPEGLTVVRGRVDLEVREAPESARVALPTTIAKNLSREARP